MGFKKAPLQKSYQLAVGAQSYTLEFTAANRQFGWLEISLVYDKSLQHLQDRTAIQNYTKMP